MTRGLLGRGTVVRVELEVVHPVVVLILDHSLDALVEDHIRLVLPLQFLLVCVHSLLLHYIIFGIERSLSLLHCSLSY